MTSSNPGGCTRKIPLNGTKHMNQVDKHHWQYISLELYTANSGRGVNSKTKHFSMVYISQ